ncbi:YifB family Mg chelatase-like AAA ATPase [Alkalihalophilus pseudofirmus]|uniref:YifB family Mg chelatase-like AAA ATPase n=1 Tax=Alkalihalophilus pseudofirmus TaxID=79885 RepID=UPI003B75B6A6
MDFRHIIGHERAKRALLVAASGEHNVLMSGPPGCGKSMLAEAFSSILPTLTKDKQLEVMSLYQLAGESVSLPLAAPYRNPHHSASSVALIGGGSNPKPGEVSLAHGGVLFLDEMAEFQKKTLDMLRQPMESGRVTISRVHSTVTYPAAFQLIGAMNPCPYGYLGSNVKYCSCTDKQVQSYRARVSGPVLDRVDILLHLIPVNLDREEEGTLSSEELRVQVERARERQYERYGAGVSNAKVPFDVISECSPLTTSQRQMVAQVSSKQQWSNRVQIKIIRLARTISDLAESELITDEALWEAMSLRRLNQSSSKLSAREL